ncbi:MAG: hypothetical protein ACLP8S_18980 [Solirubrobacteraceae bacterium]
MGRFDPELYLRLIGEEVVIDAGREQGGWGSPLDEAAGALVAIGVIPAAKARRITEDYFLAQSLRRGDGMPRMAMRARRTPRRAANVITFKRVVPLQTVIEYPEGRLELRYVLFAEPETSLSFVYSRRPQASTARGRRGTFMYGGRGPVPWSASAPTLSDQRGNNATLSFSGSGSDTQWSGRLRTDDPIAADTGWLELDGHRIELRATNVTAEVSIEEPQETDPARRHLWHLLAANDRHGPTQAIDPALDALLAAGAISPQDPAIDELNAVRERLPHHPQHNPGVAGVRKLPEPWRSLLKRVGKDDGPTGVVVLGASTPIFDGHRVGILSIESDTSGFTAEVMTTGGGMVHPRFGGPADQRIAWWARDDRANHYLGASGSWSAGADHGSGEIIFWPALDPRAERLEICPTAAHARAVISFPLRWRNPPPGEEVPTA